MVLTVAFLPASPSKSVQGIRLVQADEKRHEPSLMRDLDGRNPAAAKQKPILKLA